MTPPKPVKGSWFMLFAALPGIALIVYAAAGRFAGAEFWSILGVGALVGLAASTAGALLGFLFAVPRLASKGGGTGPLSSNTNLEQISDWLTTILIGLGLVQLGSIADGLSDIAVDLAPALGASTENAAATQRAEAVGLSVIVYMLIFGFVSSYLVTRIVISLRLREVEDHLDRRSEVLEKPLTPPPAGGPPLPDDVAAALSGAEAPPAQVDEPDPPEKA